MIDTSGIKHDMPVVCSQGGQFAVVDHLEGSEFIKLQKDELGIPHFIPTKWVTSLSESKVHIDRPGKQAMEEWATSPFELLDET